MDQKRSWGLFRKRNVLGGVLIAGIVAGVYLADFLKGFGLGSGNTWKPNSTNSTTKSTPADTNSESTIDDIAADGDAPAVIKVLIDGWTYLLRTPSGEERVELSRIVQLVKAATGDDDGIRIRIYRKPTSRVQAETDLESALAAAGIPENERVFMPTPVENVQ